MKAVTASRLVVVLLSSILVAACGGDAAAPKASSTPTPVPTPVATPTPAPTPSANPALELARRFAGTFKGTWTDARFAPGGGEVSFTFAIDENAKTITSTLVLTGPALGGAGAGTETYPPAALNLSDPTKVSFTAPSPKFGTINVSVDNGGHFIADLPNFPVGKCTFTGLSDGTNIVGTTDVTLNDGSKAGGPLTMKKQ